MLLCLTSGYEMAAAGISGSLHDEHHRLFNGPAMPPTHSLTHSPCLPPFPLALTSLDRPRRLCDTLNSFQHTSLLSVNYGVGTYFMDMMFGTYKVAPEIQAREAAHTAKAN